MCAMSGRCQAAALGEHQPCTPPRAAVRGRAPPDRRSADRRLLRDRLADLSVRRDGRVPDRAPARVPRRRARARARDAGRRRAAAGERLPRLPALREPRRQGLPALSELPAQAQGPVLELRPSARLPVADLPVLRGRGPGPRARARAPAPADGRGRAGCDGRLPSAALSLSAVVAPGRGRSDGASTGPTRRSRRARGGLLPVPSEAVRRPLRRVAPTARWRDGLPSGVCGTAGPHGRDRLASRSLVPAAGRRITAPRRRTGSYRALTFHPIMLGSDAPRESSGAQEPPASWEPGRTLTRTLRTGGFLGAG